MAQYADMSTATLALAVFPQTNQPMSKENKLIYNNLIL